MKVFFLNFKITKSVKRDNSVEVNDIDSTVA